MHYCIDKNQLRSFMRDRNQTPMELFGPYWKEIMRYVVDAYPSQPSILGQISRLLQISTKEFLKKTLPFTIPHLVVDENLAFLKMMSEIVGSEIPILCINSMSHIMALLLVQDQDVMAKGIRFVLQIALKEFQATDLETLLRSCTLSLVVALSEELGGGPAKREKSFQALCLVGRTLFKEPNVSKTNTSNHDIVRNLLKRYFLGILSHCNQVGTRSHRSVSLSNKRKSVKGLEEVLKIMSANVGFMTSQIIATLRLIFDENPRLRDETLSLWRTFVQTVDPASLAPHLVHIVIILIRPFDEYNDAQIKILASIFEYFFQKETKNFQPYYAEAPLLPEILHFAKFNQRLKEEKENLTLVQRIQILIKGISNDNELVAECSLNELLPVISDRRIYALIMTENVDENVQNLVKTLLLTLRKFNGQNLNIQRLCCRCLGVIGAIDPSRLDIAVKEDSVIVLDNFVDINESREFVCKLIEKQLVRAFRSSTNMTQQSFVAYALQQSLAFCGFTSDIVLHGVKPPSMTDSQYTEIRKQWNKFPKAVLDNITPFLESHYNLHMSQSEPVVYPIYPSTTTFRDWIKTWTIELIESVQGDNAIRIFAVCRNVVNGGDVNLALYVLPHLVLNALISGSDNLRKDVLKELLSVLNNIGGNGNRNVEQSQLCTQTIFSLVDHLSTWLRRKRTLAKKAQQVSARRAGKAIPADSIIASDSGMKRVEKLLSEIPQELMAEASYRCNAYARALLHLEQHIRLERQRCSQTQLQPLYQFLQRIYSNIDETDGMEGISTMINTHDIDQQILEYESTGRWTAAQTCYELKLRNGEQSIRPHLGLSNCLKNLGHFETMMTHITGIMNAEPEWDSTLRSHAIEASWRLGRWEDVEKLSIQPYERRFESDIGKLLLASVNGPDVVFQMELQNIRSSLIGELAASSMESYSRSYDHIVKLHMLREVEMIKPIISESAAQKLDELSLYMDYRLRITAPSYKAREPILNLRRILFDHKSLVNESTAHIWLQSAKIARKAGYYQTAQSAILHAEMMSTSYVHIERAKLLWCQGEERKAMSNLKTFLSGSISTMLNGKTYDSRVKAKTLLLLARWMESTSSSSSNEILSKYQLVLKEQPEWDKGYFFIGQYYNALLKAEQARNKDTLRNDARITKSLSLTLHVIINYAKALQYGARYVFQTLPRLLTLWLDAGNKHFLDAECRSDSDREFVKINNLIRKVIQRLPPYLFLTAFPQIVSRICHKNQNVFPVLETIMVTVLKNYPKQALWYLMSVSKSTIKSRYRRCHTIFAKVKSDPSGMSRNIELLISQANKFVDQLLALSNFAVPKSQSIISLSKEFRTLQRLVPVDLVIPLQEYLAVALPVSVENFKNHNPFASNLPTIAGFHDEVELMNSLVRPKKITIKGSDGKDYVFLCKPQDDLRKDNRLMEFNSVINKLLKRDPESRRRNLHIRTYAVIPLNETCGLIQWVPNTVAFRGILTRGYRARNIAISVSFSEVDAMLKSGPSPAKSFIDVVLPKFPSVFHEWFRESFPEPTSWFSSRLAYTRTAAVMSMVGFVLGLGDRHLENILFDETTGDTVHVDFNCLFEKGLTFAVPECVPFRLTHNMVDAMGITGYEGVFRKCCEISLNILRGNKELLLNILETFLYDPLCEWSKKKADLEKSGEIENEQAMKHITTIERKVLGSWKSGLPLSIEGQVHELITQATDPRNLAAMYIG
ncbi:hypothetical protein BKA69DRAFT_1024549 [Paraphysoderma sedebokerense]|nr:hypothetical protein BKA69DRAFT_1024420 [Paraphysoderma sedebokerense]KAI9146008.1 hypothetical protein BKA69DRAFT_1024549 [Paraphysoderma sedebokerense]